jgi:hypothetical protein
MSTAATQSEPSFLEPTEQQIQVTPEEIAQLAHSYWEARGRPDGSAEEDWFRAEQDLRNQRTALESSAS